MTTESDLASLLRDHVHPLTHVEPDSPLDDLTPLATIVGDATIVMLGEATHGTREFFQLKHRIVRYLVTNLGFTLFGIEASWPECTDINDYVVNGIGEAAQALAGQGFWTWDTEEVLSLIEWMRSYNSVTPHDRRVRFFGFDAVHAPLACTMVSHTSLVWTQHYALEIEPFAIHELGAIQPFLAPEDEQARTHASAHDQWICNSASGAPGALHRHHIRDLNGAEALQCALVLGQINEKRRESDGGKQFSLRDIAMATNVEWTITYGSEAPQGHFVGAQRTRYPRHAWDVRRIDRHDGTAIIPFVWRQSGFGWFRIWGRVVPGHRRCGIRLSEAGFRDGRSPTSGESGHLARPCLRESSHAAGHA